MTLTGSCECSASKDIHKRDNHDDGDEEGVPVRDVLQPVQQVGFNRTVFGDDLVDVLAALHGNMIADKKVRRSGKRKTMFDDLLQALCTLPPRAGSPPSRAYLDEGRRRKK